MDQSASVDFRGKGPSQKWSSYSDRDVAENCEILTEHLADTQNMAIIRDKMRRMPDRQVAMGGWLFSRWRQFFGTYDVPPLADPVYTVHFGGQTTIHMWTGETWSDLPSRQGCSTIIPAGVPTRWKVNGELDVAIISIPLVSLHTVERVKRFEEVRFAFVDPLGAALTRQILAALYSPNFGNREYFDLVVRTMRAHTLDGPLISKVDVPFTVPSACRIHQIIDDVQANPVLEYSLSDLARKCGMTPSHFCRAFKKAIGESPLKYIARMKIVRAQDMLSQTNLTISQISDGLGYSSHSHFSHQFHMFTGRTPSAWRDAAQSATGMFAVA